MKRPTTIAAAALLCVLFFVMACDLHAASLKEGNKHDLSARSTVSTIKAATEEAVCVFCHAPHSAAPDTPLWNRRTPGGPYTPYTSSTTKSNPGQPNGSSLMCLSCHDGTIALGEVLSRKTPIAMLNAPNNKLPSGSASNLGTKLSDDHPVSMAYTAAIAASRGDLANPSSLPKEVKLDPAGQMQCTSCHDPHNDGGANGKFLVMSMRGSALCVACHTKSTWNASSHKTSLAVWNGATPNPFPNTSYTTVADNACASCHKQHTGLGSTWLMNALKEEDNCYPCHNGHVASKNIQSEFTKTSVHPVASNTGVHDPAEAVILAGTRHVECSDCHNSHATNASAGPHLGSNSPMSGSLLGVRGVTITGTTIANAVYEYQVCFRCHGDSAGQPAPAMARQITETNIRKKFDTVNSSYHPVAGIGKSPALVGMLAPWTATMTMQCQDCHNNNAAPANGGTGPNGPHGSSNPYLLERAYTMTGSPNESLAQYAICYKCHDRAKILSTSNASTKFTLHKKHISDEKTPCAVCHDPHGIPASGQANLGLQKSGLLNFYVGPGTHQVTPLKTGTNAGKLYADTTTQRCYLVCHGESHNGEGYN